MLLTLLWPEADSERGRALFRNALHNIRRASNGPWLEINRDEASFRAGQDNWVDLHAFLGLVADGRSHRHTDIDSSEECHRTLREAAVSAGNATESVGGGS